MDTPRTKKKDWVLTQGAFNLLLARLNPDRELAAREYESLRRALITYFECHGSLSPAEHTDETFNLVARSLSEGKDIYIETPAGYFYGVARNVLRQHRKERAKAFALLDDVPPQSFDSASPHRLFEMQEERDEHERRLTCLEQCLDTLPRQNRSLILDYYHGETGIKIDNRKAMAERLGISMSSLRVRALRLREKLEACARECMEGSGPMKQNHDFSI